MQTMRILNEQENFPTSLNFLERVDVIIDQNLDNVSFCMADLQGGLLMSSSQIYRKIKQQTECSPSVYIRRIRLKYAHALILNSDLSLSEISYRVGFNGLSYFSRCFSNFYGSPPSSLRSVRA